MLTIAHIASALSLLASGALLGGALYDAVVLAPNLRGGPAGLEQGRQFMSAATPANFFRVLSPASQILMLLSLVVHWPDQAARWPLVASLAALIVADVITFTYHYPRNRLMFTAPLTQSAEALNVAARQWAKANIIRVLLVLGAWFGALSVMYQ